MPKSCTKPTQTCNRTWMWTRQFHFFVHRRAIFSFFMENKLEQTKSFCVVCCFWPAQTSAAIVALRSATGHCAVFLSAGSDGRWSAQAVGRGMVWHIGVSKRPKWLGCETQCIFLASKNQFLGIDIISLGELLETGLQKASPAFRFGSNFFFSMVV